MSYYDNAIDQFKLDSMIPGDYLAVLQVMNPQEYIAAYIDQSKLENIGESSTNFNSPVESSFPLNIHKFLFANTSKDGVIDAKLLSTDFTTHTCNQGS